jgi:hypothetical protein
MEHLDKELMKTHIEAHEALNKEYASKKYNKLEIERQNLLLNEFWLKMESNEIKHKNQMHKLQT